MLGQQVALGVEEGAAVLVLGDPAPGKGAVLDVPQHGAHVLLHLLMGQHPGTGDVFAEFGGVGDGVVHGRNTALVDQVHDQLDLVDALKIGVLRLVARLAQHLKAALHQVHQAAAEDGLLAEQVGLGLVVHRGLHDTGTGSADAGDVGQGQVQAVAGGVLLHGHKAGHALARHVLAADRVAGTLGGRHEHVHPGGGHDLLVADVEAVGKGDGFPLGQVGGDLGGVHLRLTLVVDENHDHVGGLRGLSHGQNGEAVLLRHWPALAAAAQTDHHVAAAVPQVQRVGMALGAVADDGDLFAVQPGDIAVLLVIHLCHCSMISFCSLLIW